METHCVVRVEGHKFDNLGRIYFRARRKHDGQDRDEFSWEAENDLKAHRGGISLIHKYYHQIGGRPLMPPGHDVLTETDGKGKSSLRFSPEYLWHEGLLGSKIWKPPSLELYIENQRRTKLLTLPSEIRNRIMTLVLDQFVDIWYIEHGDRDIKVNGVSHVSHEQGGFFHRASDFPPPQDDPRVKNDIRTEISGDPASGHTHTVRKYVELDSRLTRIWRVCRQLYLETRLLIYSVPTFSFPTTARLNWWLEMLKPRQRDAITCLSPYWEVSPPGHRSCFKLPREVFDSMPGLMKIRLIEYRAESMNSSLYKVQKSWEDLGLQVSVYKENSKQAQRRLSWSECEGT